VAESKLYKISSESSFLKTGLREHLQSLRRKVSKLNWPKSFGSDYVISAIPEKDQQKDSNASLGIALKDYESAIQKQNQIFPMDEYR